MRLLRVNDRKITANHLARNGLIERFHPKLKCSPMPQVDVSPLILLEIHSTITEDIDCTLAELFYGTTLVLLGQQFNLDESTSSDSMRFASCLL